MARLLVSMFMLLFSLTASAGCDSIVSAHKRATCKAWGGGNEADCGQISDVVGRAFCKAGLTGDSGYCSSIPKSDVRKLCGALMDNDKAECGAISDSATRTTCFSESLPLAAPRHRSGTPKYRRLASLACRIALPYAAVSLSS